MMIKQLGCQIKRIMGSIRTGLHAPVYIGRRLSHVSAPAWVIWPVAPTRLCCGIAGLVAYVTPPDNQTSDADLAALESHAQKMNHSSAECRTLYENAIKLRGRAPFYTLLTQPALRARLTEVTARVQRHLDQSHQQMAEQMGTATPQQVDDLAQRIEWLEDTIWRLTREIQGNIDRVNALSDGRGPDLTFAEAHLYGDINAILNSIDRLEVRGRDSCGISLIVYLDQKIWQQFADSMARNPTGDILTRRCQLTPLINQSITIGRHGDDVSVTLTYKVAAEVGGLGDNIRFLRQQIAQDALLHQLLMLPFKHHGLCAHTRWASVGAISEANCHPIDNRTLDDDDDSRAVIHVCLNGDIDNYRQLLADREADGCRLPEQITTDTKIIPLQIAAHLRRGCDITEAFRRAVNDFDGSHAICMQTDLAPGKLFLAQRGSGQTLFVGLAADHFMAVSEVYGLIEETSRFVKIDGQFQDAGTPGGESGRIFVLDSRCAGQLAGISACAYDGAPIQLTDADIHDTAITSRDIDRQDFPHYFLKEITESPTSVENTLRNRWRINDDATAGYRIDLDDRALPPGLRQAVSDGRIQRVFFVGQGTAGVAAQACANILQGYSGLGNLNVSALKSSEMSGFQLAGDMHDCLVIAISQSGTTTDTNRTIDLVRERGASTLAIVNRRESDITFKVDGVMYTSTGRDIEMSVASTKAFYGQIVAGALLGLAIARLHGDCTDEFISDEIEQLLRLPEQMRHILAMKSDIERSAARLAVGKTYWAAVGSGPNKAAADEIRIKLSELCYKTISSDFVEDKKHIDLSSEPLIIVCAAGSRESVLGDIVKDTAIFKAHKATPIVIADEGDDRFVPYADDLFYIPRVREHLSPILITLVGHLWGYYAALAINDGSRMLYRFREDMRQMMADTLERKLDPYELVLDKAFRTQIITFYRDFRQRKATGQLPSILGIQTAADLILLLKYLAGKLPVADFELDFGVKGAPLNMLNRLMACLDRSISSLSRPIDAIKHQAKTVTVGTSRISQQPTGLLFDALLAHGVQAEHLINRNVVVLNRLQKIVAHINGSILYRIDGLDALGEPIEATKLKVLKKTGILKSLTSRIETDPILRGTKKIIVREGNVYIGQGRGDKRSILIVPVISASPQHPNVLAHLVLFNIGFQDHVGRQDRIQALGGKFERIKNIVQENSLKWADACIDDIKNEDLFGLSAEKLGEMIIARAGGQQ